MVRPLLLILPIALLLQGCAIFGAVTPRSDARIKVYTPLQGADGIQHVGPMNTIEFPQEWDRLDMVFDLEEEYHHDETGYALKSRKLSFQRSSDPLPAGEVAMQRAEAARDTIDIAGTIVGAMVRQMIELEIRSRELDAERSLAEIEAELRRALEAPEHHHHEPPPQERTPENE